VTEDIPIEAHCTPYTVNLGYSMMYEDLKRRLLVERRKVVVAK
jgi:hypothetical protein